MALVEVTLTGRAPITPGAAAAPTTNETITDPDNGTWLEIIAGGTAVTVTVVRPGTHDAGDAVTDLSIGPLTSTTRWIRIGPEYADPTDGNADVSFSSVATTTARLWRMAG